jgi:hypothetical protein
MTSPKQSQTIPNFSYKSVKDNYIEKTNERRSSN